MSQIQCSTCGDAFDSWAELNAHKRWAHLSHTTLRQPLRKHILRAALALTLAIGLAFCGDEAAPAYAAPVEPDPAPVAVSPVPLCVSPSLGPIPCGSQDACADAFLCPTPQAVAAGEPPVLPVTGGTDLALSLIALGFVLVGLTMVRPWWRRGR